MGQKVVLHGNEKFLRATLPQLMALYQIIEGKDIGQFLGMPIDEYVKRKPMVSPKLLITFYSVQKPPFTKRYKKNDKGEFKLENITRATYGVPDVPRSRLEWEQIKTACGGLNGYMWGRFRCTANLDNNRQMAIYAASADEAEDRLKALAALSSAKILTLSTTEEKKEGVRANNKGLEKQPIRIYPAFFTILHMEKILAEINAELGTSTLSGNYLKRKATIPLWTDEKPSDFDAVITDLLRVRGQTG